MRLNWFAILCLYIGFLTGSIYALVSGQEAKGKGLNVINCRQGDDLISNQPTPFAVMYEIKRAGIKHPEIAFAQVRLETGFDTCSLGFRTNNLWCFATKKHLRFEHWRESIYFYRVWQIRTGYDTGDYYAHLRKYWGATDMNEYIANLKGFR